MNSKFLLATVCDSKDVDSAKQFFYAAVAYGQWPGSLMLLCKGLDLDVIDWFESRGILVRHCEPVIPDVMWAKHREVTTVGPAAVLKYILFGTEFHEWDTVVYMDTDILIRGPIHKLSKLQGLYAVPDELSNVRQHFMPDWAEAKKPPHHVQFAPAFNTGVMVFSPKKIPSGIYHELVSALVENMEFCRFAEQSVFNLIFCNQWKRLPSNYNLMINMVAPHASRREDAQLRRARVLHFAGHQPAQKPWSKQNVFYRDWMENLSAAECHLDFRQIPQKSSQSFVSDMRMEWILTVIHFRKMYRQFIKKRSIKICLRKLRWFANFPLSLINPVYRIKLKSIKRQPWKALVVGNNVSGPSVIRVPSWVNTPLGQYYMYFGGYEGDRIHLAYADDLNGPWIVHESGTLKLDDADWFEGHVASPDVHVDHQDQRIRMYFHAPAKFRKGECTGLAFSRDGLTFNSQQVYIGNFYARIFKHDGWHYAIAKNWNDRWSRLYRSKDGVSEFEVGPQILKDSRHTGVYKDGNDLMVFYSRVGDAPERIILSIIRLDAPWNLWKEKRCISVIKPETPYEGSDYPLLFSEHGPAIMARQLRDPYVYAENGQIHLFYSIAGEMGIAKARLQIVGVGSR